MNTSVDDSIKGLLSAAADKSLLSFGRLMSPAEVLKSVDPTKANDDRIKGWFLCGDVHPELFRAIESGTRVIYGMHMRLGSGGTPFMVVRQRASAWEHRFLMPLAGEMARSFCGEISKTGLGISVGTSDGTKAIVERVYLATQNFVYTNMEFSAEPSERIEITLDVLEQTILLLNESQEKRPEIGNPKVCVTTILPSDLAIQWASVVARERGELH